MVSKFPIRTFLHSSGTNSGHRSSRAEGYSETLEEVRQDHGALRDFSGLLTKCTTLKAGEFYLCESENYEIGMKVMNERKDQTIQKNSREESCGVDVHRAMTSCDQSGLHPELRTTEAIPCVLHWCV